MYEDLGLGNTIFRDDTRDKFKLDSWGNKLEKIQPLRKMEGFDGEV